MRFLLLSALLANRMAAGEEAPAPYTDIDWDISLGAFFADQDMKTRFSFEMDDSGDRIDLENDLGFKDSQSVFRIAASRNFTERHQANLDIFDLSQTSKATLEKDIEWGDTVFPIDAQIVTNLDLTIYKVDYAYYFWRGRDFRLGLNGGLYIADIGLKLRTLDREEQEGGEVTAPLPVLGLRGEYFFSDDWRISASSEWFGLEFDGYDGTLHDLMVAIDYRFSRRTGLGIGYNIVEINVDTTEKALRADLLWQYSGLFAYLRTTF